MVYFQCHKIEGSGTDIGEALSSLGIDDQVGNYSISSSPFTFIIVQFSDIEAFLCGPF